MPRLSLPIRTAAVVGSACLAVLAGVQPSSAANGWEVVASGLDSPRQLSFAPTGALYVAEAGRGGVGPCVVHPELGEMCLGASGAITEVKDGQQRRVVTGLPSIGGAQDVIGPSDVDVTGDQSYAITIGLAGSPEFRSAYGSGGAALGTLVTGKLKHGPWSVLADVADNEARVNPEPTDIDSNPVGVLRQGSRYLVADAGGNDLLSASKHGSFQTLAVFPDTMVDAPPFLGLPPGTQMPMDAVPTAVAIGPDGAMYVSQLTGFPFPAGGSTIWRIAGGSAPTAFATGLTNVTDLAFAADGSLYAVQLATNGLLSGSLSGSLVRVTRGAGSHATVAGDLFAPYGVAVRGGSAYVTTCSVCTGGGQVLRIPLG